MGAPSAAALHAKRPPDMPTKLVGVRVCRGPVTLDPSLAPAHPHTHSVCGVAVELITRGTHDVCLDPSSLAPAHPHTHSLCGVAVELITRGTPHSDHFVVYIIAFL